MLRKIQTGKKKDRKNKQETRSKKQESSLPNPHPKNLSIVKILANNLSKRTRINSSKAEQTVPASYP